MRARTGRPAPARDGFALLAVLWVITGVAALALGVSLIARDGVATAQNRVDLARAAWRAEGCLERARAVIAEVLSQGESSPLVHGMSWASLDRAVAASPLVVEGQCLVSLRAAGAAVDIGTADEEIIRRALIAARTSPARADSLTDALLDWRDGDDVPRPLGAEHSWYESQGRRPPRNAALSDIRELAFVRGFAEAAGLDTLITIVFSVEPGRIALNHAPLVVLAALPGFTEEVIARLEERRFRAAPVTDLISLSSEISPAARAVIASRFADLTRLTTAEPDAWVVTSRASEGLRGVTAVAEVRLVRAGSRAAVVRRRTWVD